MAIFAHPDDESYRAGGLLTLLAQKGVQVHVVTATRGEAGLNPTCASQTPEELAKIREEELKCACQALQIQPPHILNFRDGQLPEADPAVIIRELLQIIQKIQPQVVLGFGPDGLSGHPDHIAIGNFASQAFQQYQKAGALYQMAVPSSVVKHLGMNQLHPVPDAQISLSVNVTSVWDMKMKAIHCHASQVASSPILTRSDEAQREFLGVEHFIRSMTLNPDLDFIPGLLKEQIL